MCLMVEGEDYPIGKSSEEKLITNWRSWQKVYGKERGMS